MVRKLLAGFALLSITLTLTPQMVLGQDVTPTTVIVPVPSSEGCEDIPEYVAELERVRATIRELWTRLFPGVPFPTDMSNDEFTTFLAALTPAELISFAEVYEERARLDGEVVAPEVANAYHRTRIAGAEATAAMFRHASSIGIDAAFPLYVDMLAQLQGLEDAQGAAALAVCPAFHQVLDYNANDDAGTPEAG